jgi:hypothetical protein
MAPAASERTAISVEQEGDYATEKAAAARGCRTAADGLKNQRE